MTPGTSLGPYQLIGQIGEGGMGEVWKARDTRLDRVVAVKVSKLEFTERFEREARAIAALNHPNICQLYDVGPNYLVMEYIEGTQLKGPVPVERAVEYACQILDALDAAHKKGITHRDLKPANILLTKQGIKLLDFGLAKQTGPLKQTDATLTKALTAEGQIAGTLQYMAPEQLQAKEADARSDIFAFGCVLYEILSGKKAFAGTSAASVIAAVLEREPAPIQLTPPLDRVIRTCLAKDPDQRFQTAADLKRNLLWALEQPSASASKTSAQWPKWVAIATVLATMSLAAVWLLKPAPEERLLTVTVPSPRDAHFVSAVSTSNDGGFALSPDGRMVAFVARKEGRSQIWVRPLDSQEARVLPGTEDGFRPFWSPDSRWVGFFTLGTLKKAEVAGGTALRICPARYGRGGTWNQDGLILYGDNSRQIYRVAAAGGTPEPVTRLDDSRRETTHRYPSFLPDGRHFAYSVTSGSEEFNGIAIASLDRSEKIVWIGKASSQSIYAPAFGNASHGPAAGHLLFVRDDMLVALPFDANTLQVRGEPIPITTVRSDSGYASFSVSTDGFLLYSDDRATGMRLIWRDRKGQVLSPASTQSGVSYYSEQRISPSGKRMAFQQRNGTRGEIFIIDLEDRRTMRLTYGGGAFPLWSPDESSILHTGIGQFGLFRKLASGAGKPEPLTATDHAVFPQDLSGDGKWLLYVRNNIGSSYDLMILPMAEGGKPYPYLNTKFEEGQGQFSPGTPRWMAYATDESGTREVYVQVFTPGQPASGGRWQISAGGGTMPRWRGDGKELYYLALDGTMMAVAVQADGAAFQASKPVPLFQTTAATKDRSTFSYDVTRDGQRFVLTEPDPLAAPSSLTLVTNWWRKARKP